MKPDEKQKAAVHYGIAERGKMHSLEGNHKEALRHYREALQMTKRDGSSDVFFQHYTQCVMESLERSGAHDEVISYCEKARDFLEGQEVITPHIKKSIATLMERQAVQHLYREEREDAVDLLKGVQQLVGRRSLPLSDDLLNWAQRGYQINKQQIEGVQKRHKYFVVRKENVNPTNHQTHPTH